MAGLGQPGSSMVSDFQESWGSKVGRGDNPMAHLVPSLCFLTQDPGRDRGYHLHFTDEEMRLREV